ncbi:Metallo-dependent phosphatase [Gigaspora margarita]|uniref:Metallo-dependent phosphatase n=1 Tax=Gigaspora margarita TaxID=4874 RepID=A0A8H4AEN7_GIGMA|nr:Metallo-dependent phosphatase [Gigaspora margarita]
MKLFLFFITFIQGVILISGNNSHNGDNNKYTKYVKGTDLYKRPKGSIGTPYPTTFKENYSGDLKFLVFGDWGQKGPGTGQNQVAKAMVTWANHNKTTFVLNAGDSFYQTTNTTAPNVTDASDHEGVSSISDTKWKSYWLDIYGGRLKDITWYSVAGNHDWYNNVTAEVDYFWDVDSRFFLPSLYYVRKVTFGSGVCAAFIHFDTDPYFYNYSSYTKKNNLKQTLTDLNLHTDEQLNDRLKWLEDQLVAVQDADWIFVLGHHPLDGDCRLKDTKNYYLMYELPPILEKHGVSAYFNGHAHELAVSLANSTSPVTYFGSGAGGAKLEPECKNPTWTSPFTFGFLSVSIPADGKFLHFDYVDANNTDTPPKVIYSGSVKSRKNKTGNHGKGNDDKENHGKGNDDKENHGKENHGKGNDDKENHGKGNDGKGNDGKGNDWGYNKGRW